jgi:superfamily I DNA/RNA helicase
VIESALSGLAREGAAEVVVSTGHRGKGRQWPSVQLADDFPVGTPDKPLPPEESRLQYVAVTRAQHVLDLSACPTLAQEVQGA